MPTLIANSGIQFITRKINLGDKSQAMATRFEFALLKETDTMGNTIHSFAIPFYDEKEKTYVYIEQDEYPELFDRCGNIKDISKVRPEQLKKISEKSVLTANAREMLDIFEGVWLPLPYFRMEYFEKTEIHLGPETWSRLFLSKIKSNEDSENGKYTHAVTLAFDTNCTAAKELNRDLMLVPTIEDAQGYKFTCVDDTKCVSKLVNWLGQRDWVDQWIVAEIKKKGEKIIERRFDIKNIDESPYLYVGLYMTFLKALNKGEAFPDVTLHTHSTPIEVDLILDVGNSRTCGLVVESAPGSQLLNITDARPLKIRYMTKPENSSGEPFDMKLAFVKETFGSDAAGPLSGNIHAFKYPSLVRVGKEAIELSNIYDTGESNSVFSSPKRYLWDTQKKADIWTYVPLSQEPFARPALYGISDKFTNDGRLLSKAQKNALIEGLPRPSVALNPYYSNSSLMTFALVEIILQALSYINSDDYRKDTRNVNIPRKLKRIVLTCPTAMLKKEKQILRESAQDAVTALTEYFKELLDVHLDIIPDPEIVKQMDISPTDIDNLETIPAKDKRLEWGFDEATCSQITFLFNEITYRFKNENVQLYFDVVGKKREDAVYPEKKSVTIASIDIGGGTTDLMICAYQTDPKADVPVLTPDPLFWEGFNLAGDNILKRVIELLVLEGIKDEAQAKGCRNTDGVMSSLFGDYLNGQSHKDRMMKKYFVNQIAIPVAYGFLEFAQKSDIDSETRAFDAFFKHYSFPNQNLVDHINHYFQRFGAVDFDIRQVNWTISREKINQVVRNIIGEMLGDLCGIIAQFDCDYVLLSGRPTNLPIVRDIILENLPAPPDRIIALGNYRVGSWYPFNKTSMEEGHTGKIGDPKTCVVVGATIALMSGTLARMNGFRTQRERLANKVVSTANYIGLYEENAARVRTVYFDEVQGNYDLIFNDKIFIGMRQMANNEWIGSAMYKLAFKDNAAAEALANLMPLTVQLEIRNRDKDKEKIEIRRITNKLGNHVEKNQLSLSLQTLTDEYGYWLDTGIFKWD